jgi:hypothetical protein
MFVYSLEGDALVAVKHKGARQASTILENTTQEIFERKLELELRLGAGKCQVTYVRLGEI